MFNVIILYAMQLIHQDPRWKTLCINSDVLQLKKKRRKHQINV